MMKFNLKMILLNIPSIQIVKKALSQGGCLKEGCLLLQTLKTGESFQMIVNPIKK
jgi:hypothetical protein